MEKETKNKETTPKPQKWDKTDRNLQRTTNEKDVRGEMDIRRGKTNGDKKKTGNKNKKI